MNYAHHRRPPSGLPRPTAWTRIYAPREHHFHRIDDPKALQLPHWSRGEPSAGATRPYRRRAARQVGYHTTDAADQVLRGGFPGRHGVVHAGRLELTGV